MLSSFHVFGANTETRFSFRGVSSVTESLLSQRPSSSAPLPLAT